MVTNPEVVEEAWLKEKHVAYSLKMVDTDQAEAQKMVEKTGQMGVPVTGITFDDGTEEYIVGFDKGKLQSILN